MPSWLRRRYPAIDYYPRRNRRRALRAYSRYKYSRRISRRRNFRRRYKYPRQIIHKFKVRFVGHWPADWPDGEPKTYYTKLIVQNTTFDKATNYELYRIKGTKIHFIPKHSAEQPEVDTNGTDYASQMWIRNLHTGILPNNYDGSDVRADEYEDSKLVYLSGPKTFYNSHYCATGYIPAQPIRADPSPDSTIMTRVSISARKWHTFADDIDYWPFMFTINRNVSDDYDFYYTSWIHCKGFVNKQPEIPTNPPPHPINFFRFELIDANNPQNRIKLNPCKSEL